MENLAGSAEEDACRRLACQGVPQWLGPVRGHDSSPAKGRIGRQVEPGDGRAGFTTGEQSRRYVPAGRPRQAKDTDAYCMPQLPACNAPRRICTYCRFCVRSDPGSYRRSAMRDTLPCNRTTAALGRPNQGD